MQCISTLRKLLGQSCGICQRLLRVSKTERHCSIQSRKKNISFSEAKSQVQQRMISAVGTGAGARRPGMSYAAAAQSTRCASTQTELTWPPNFVFPVSTQRTNASSTETSQTSTEEVISINARDSYQAAGAIPKTVGSNIPRNNRTETRRYQVLPDLDLHPRKVKGSLQESLRVPRLCENI